MFRCEKLRTAAETYYMPGVVDGIIEVINEERKYYDDFHLNEGKFQILRQYILLII